MEALKQIYERSDRTTDAGLGAPAVTHPANQMWLDRNLFPISTLFGAIGVCLVALADTTARRGYPAADLFFWLGLLCMVLPAALALLAGSPTRRDSILIVCVTALDLYLVKFLHSPVRFTFLDEFAHWNATIDILRSHHLFGIDPLLPISSYFPGVENVIVALVQVGHLPVFPVVIVIMAVIRLFSTLSLYLLFEGMSGSSKLAALGSLIFMGNPEYIFFSAQFSYKQLALPLAFFALLLVFRRITDHDHTLPYTVCTLLVLSAIVVTHHIVAYWLLLLILVIEAVRFVTLRTQNTSFPREPGFGLLFLVGVTAWLLYVASSAVHILKGEVGVGVLGILKVALREESSRRLFVGQTAAFAIPLWQRIDTSATVAFLLLSLWVGLLILLRRRALDAFTLTFYIAALMYPVALALRFSPAGIESSLRLAELSFVSLALVAAAGTVWLLDRSSGATRLPVVIILSLALTSTVFSSVLFGFVPTTRLPGPYLVAADARSVEPEGIDAAIWARQTLGPDRRMAADRTNRNFLGTYGLERPVLGGTDPFPVAPLYFSRSFTSRDRTTVRIDHIQYVLVDLRMAQAPPLVPLFDLQNPVTHGKVPSAPVSRDQLLKFDHVQGVSRIFDSGDIVIFDTRAVLR